MDLEQNEIVIIVIRKIKVVRVRVRLLGNIFPTITARTN